MLALTRNIGESVVLLADDVTIRVTVQKGRSIHTGSTNRVKLVFDAPPKVRILREELLQDRRKPNK